MAAIKTSIGTIVDRFGISEVYTAANPLVDIVLVHGLNGHPFDTWSTKKPPVYWPVDLLPRHVKTERVRVLTYGYNAEVTSFAGGTSKDRIHNHAENLVAQLHANRSLEDATERPIIFVCHSLGGLVVKRALTYSRSLLRKNVEHLRSIFVATYGILFLGTPHAGSDLAKWGTMLQAISSAMLPKKFLDSSPQLVEALKSQDETLQNINRFFSEIENRFHLYFFHEALPTDLKGTRQFIVDEFSAAPTMGGVERASIEADHSHMCKFETKRSPGYLVVVEGIKRYARDAPEIIKTRWPKEREALLLERKAAVAELLPNTAKLLNASPQNYFAQTFDTPDQSTGSLPLHESPVLIEAESATPPSTEPTALADHEAPLFFVPQGFQRNLVFVGMVQELKELESKLSKKSVDGVGCVLLHGMAGVGKSHLAREYVYGHQDQYRGGIFWIRAKYKEEIWQDLWAIAQRVALKDLVSPSGLQHEAEKKPFIDAVMFWFRRRRDWLVIFDGLAFDQDEDITRFQELIPRSNNCSLLFISRTGSLALKQRLLNPQPMKVQKLSVEDANAMFFKELGLNTPTELEQKKATELVQKMERLPLAIHAVGRRLRETREPLQKYSLKSYYQVPKLAEVYSEIMDDLGRLNFIEACNLMNILCFFGRHIPVEMVHLGLRALRHANVEVMTRLEGGKRDINTTYSVLMRYALLDRNDPDDRSQRSSSRESFIDTIDMLKLHSVVQDFCVDLLKAKGELSRWIGLAVKVFCASFEEADFRIKHNTEGAVLVSDYREYEIHATRILSHVERHMKRMPELGKVKNELQDTLEKIQREIDKETPNSSQEAVSGQKFQFSIFDRTSFSSSAGPETPGPDSSFMTTSTMAPVNLPQLDIPTSNTVMRSPPASGSLNHPVMLFPDYPRDEDPGYTSDRDETPTGLSRRASPDNYTPRQRPYPDGVLESPAMWSLPTTRSANENPRQHRTLAGTKRRKDLGTFRMLSSSHLSPTSTSLSTIDAYGCVTRPQRLHRGNISGSSDAITSLSAVHKGSPPRPRGGRNISFGRSPLRTASPQRENGHNFMIRPSIENNPRLPPPTISTPKPDSTLWLDSAAPSPTLSQAGLAYTSLLAPHRPMTRSAPQSFAPFPIPPPRPPTEYQVPDVAQPEPLDYINASYPIPDPNSHFFGRSTATYSLDDDHDRAHSPLGQDTSPAAPYPDHSPRGLSVDNSTLIHQRVFSRRGHETISPSLSNHNTCSISHPTSSVPLDMQASLSVSELVAPRPIGYTSLPMSRNVSAQSHEVLDPQSTCPNASAGS